MRRGVAQVLFGTAVAAFVLGPFAAAYAGVPAALPTPCSPTESTIGGKTAFTFSAPAECTFTPAADLNGATYTILAVGGGGGGGAYGGGGGGGGEARQLVGYTAALNSKLVILVGAGGTGGIRTATGASNNPAGGQSSLVWTVDPDATSRSTSALVEAKGGGPGGGYNTAGSGGSSGTGGTGGTRLATGQGGMAPMSTSPGTPGADGALWTLSGTYFGGGGGGGICANGSLTPSVMDPLSGGRDGGGASAGKRPAPVNYTSDGSDASPGTGSGGGAGAGCANAFAGGASTANGGSGGRGAVILVVTARAATTTTAATTTGATTTVATSRTSTTLAASATATTLPGTVTVPKVTTTTVKTTSSTLKSTATTLVSTAVTPTSTATAGSTTTVATAGTPTTVATAGDDASGTTRTTTLAGAAATATVPAPPEILPSRPVFFGGIKTAAEYFGIEFGAAVGRPVRGANIRGSATDLQPGSTVRAVLRSDPVVLGEFTVGPDGTVQFDVVLPDDVPEGDHSLTFEAVSADGVPVSSVTVFSVDPSGVTETVVAAAETVGAPVEQSAVERSAAAEVPVYDTERHVGRTAAIAATAVVITSLAGMAVTQATGGLGMSFQAPSAGGSSLPGAPSAPARPGQDGPGSVAQRREDEYGIAAENDGPTFDGDGDDDDEEEAEISGSEANLLEHDGRTEPGPGDRWGLWMLPGYAPVDRFLRGAVSATSSWTVLGTRVLQDGHWLRAATGVVAPVLWLVGLVLGAGSALGLPGLVTAPGAAVVSVVVALSLLDAMTGAAAWTGFTVVALATGNVTTLFDARTLLGLGVLFVALPSIGSKIRPFTRAAEGRDGATLLDRAGDYVIMPALLAYAASTAYSALNGLSGLEMVPADRASGLVTVVLAASYVRLLGEDAVRVWFPRRSVTVRVPVEALPRPAARLGTVAVGAVLYMLAAAPFFGLGWRTWLMVGLVSLVPVLGLAEERFPNIVVVHRWFPRGLLRFVLMMFVTAWFGRFVLSLADNPVDARPVAVFMLLPGVLVGLVDLVGREGGDWRDSNVKRLAGLALWIVAVAVLSGRITV